MLVLLSDSEAVNCARNMTGLFTGPVDATAVDQVDLVLDTRWRGITARRNFPQAGTRGTFTQWYSSFAHPRPPVDYVSSLDMGAVDDSFIPCLASASTGAATVDGTQAPHVFVGYKADEDNTASTWSLVQAATISIYVSVLYDDVKQESHPNKVVAGVSVAAGKELAIYVAVNFADASNYLMNKRCTGARVYYENTNDEAESGRLYQLVEVDFEKGCKKPESSTYSAWINETANRAVGSHTGGATASNRTTTNAGAFIFVDPPLGFTFEDNAGYPMFVNTHARYKTSAIANGRLFVGNTFQSGVADGDRMIGSPFNQYDILPEIGDVNIIRVAAGDGDQIVALMSYSDRILQFKKRTLYIIK